MNPMKTGMTSWLASLLAALTLVSTAFGESASHHKQVLFFSKASSWEQKIVHRIGDQLSFLETAVQRLGKESDIEFTFSKDGGIFRPENIAGFDAFFFFTSGDMTAQARNGRGDNYPLMTLDGKKTFLDAIRNGKGFIGSNTAVYTFTDPVSPGETRNETNTSRYTRMIGAGYIGHNEVQVGRFSHVDRGFPGRERVPADYQPVDQWYAFKTFMPDLHVIMAADSARLMGNLYERSNYPIAWPRLEGKGRVFYTAMGHTTAIWKDPVFRQMILGGVNWVTGLVEADVRPNLPEATPHANEIPEAAPTAASSNPSKLKSN